jgi:hypothetical protein
MTAPTRGLSTIRETEDAEEVDQDFNQSGSSPSHPLNDLGEDAELFVKSKSSVKQFRRPRVKREKTKDSAEADFAKTLPAPAKKEASKLQQQVPKTDEEIESAGTAFLDTIGRSLGIRQVCLEFLTVICVPISHILSQSCFSSHRESLAGEERRVGSSHHRKTHSRGTSIDWTLLSDDRSYDSSPLSPIRTSTIPDTNRRSDMPQPLYLC